MGMSALTALVRSVQKVGQSWSAAGGVDHMGNPVMDHNQIIHFLSNLLSFSLRLDAGTCTSAAAAVDQKAPSMSSTPYSVLSVRCS